MAPKGNNKKAAPAKKTQSKVTKPAAKKAAPAKKAAAAVEEPKPVEPVEEQTKEEQLELAESSEESSEDEAFDGFSEDEEEKDEKKPEEESKELKEAESKESTHEFKTLITKSTKQQSKKEKATKKGLVYLSRLPKGFEKEEITKYFNQFGDITNIHVPVSKRTGNFKHYAFLEFSNAEDAKIAVETMNNYLVLGHILKAKLMDNEEFKAPKHNKKYYNNQDKYALKNDVKKLNENVENKRAARREALKAKGIDF
ncbi:hypothetical protein WICPIJ_002857 [Wickerhamomyces pijperi]|uniref:RRM domain-containing protein n=1 Tax=Wickerhamomyces pijperi TaxID=599730 RepID=A0A9P8Q8D8_WICPI|nr:hypothetical protein WICPIJ_002857 [Wickerhamomyces pijperi]